MESLLSLENLFTLLMLILLQAVLGFDNLLYISIESGRVEAERQKFVRWLGISLAIILRLVLMVVVLGLFNSLTQPLFGAQLDGIFEASFTFHSIVSIFGGGFIMWTATKEIMHLLAVEHVENLDKNQTKSVPVAIATRAPLRTSPKSSERITSSRRNVSVLAALWRRSTTRPSRMSTTTVSPGLRPLA